MHLMYEFYFWGNTSIYADFLLVENFLIVCAFVWLAFVLIKRKEKGLILNLIYWLIFTITVIIIKPEYTTLNIFAESFFINQWLLLFVVGMLVITINGLALYKKKG